MKMVQGAGTIADWTSYVYNCRLGQWNYKMYSSGNLAITMMLYIDFGTNAPGFVTAELVHTCGATAGTIEAISLDSYVIGQDTNGRYYGVFDTFNETTTAPCFVIALTFDVGIWFSQEYCVVNNAGFCASQVISVKGCYGNLDPLISYDAEGIYFGQSQGGTQGSSNLVYQHQFTLTNGEITLNSIKNDFKSGRSRNFRTESQDIYLFQGELIPEWYIKHVDAVFKRGEVHVSLNMLTTGEVLDDNIGTDKFLVGATVYEKVDECVKGWKPNVNLIRNQYQSFSCEVNPCNVVVDGGGGGGDLPCCDPAVIDATVVFTDGNTVTINFSPCSPTPASGYNILYRLVGSTGGYTSGGNYTSSPAEFGVGGIDGDQYEGYIYSDCNGVLGNMIAWTTGAAVTYSLTEGSCDTGIGNVTYTIAGGTPGDVVTVVVTMAGSLKKLSGSFTRAYITVVAPEGVPGSQTVSSLCHLDTAVYPLTGGDAVQATVVITLTGTTAVFSVTAVVENSSTSTISCYATITDVNGDAKNINSGGACRASSANGGSSPC